jgi:hypothetical protein
MNTMKKTLLASSLLLTGSLLSQLAMAYDVKDLGGELTAWGAIAGANADGSIPAYTGGVKPPANYDPANPGFRPNPFADDKPVLVINASNYKEHKEKLSESLVQMFEKYPETFRINVFPTRRSVSYPDSFLENSKLNANRCKTINGPLGLDTSTGCAHGIAFPVPKNGLEVMWNHGTAYRGVVVLQKNYQGKYVKPSGERVLSYNADSLRYQPFYEPNRTPTMFYGYRMEYTGPSRLSGQSVIVLDMLANSERRANNYSPATRRVRLSPDSAADTPVSQVGGAMTFDDDTMFAGKKDRYEWNLIGRKEMYIPFNNYRYQYTDKDDAECYGDAKFIPGHPKSECVRWELQRVWHVQAVLKEGQRHVYQKRDLFISEDTYVDGYAQMFDTSGNLYRLNMQMNSPFYESKTAGTPWNTVIDMNSGVYAALSMAPGEGMLAVESMPEVTWSPATLTRRLIK